MAVTDALSALFEKASALSGVGSSYYSRLAYIESTNNPNAQNDKSSAGGLFQFIDSTWARVGSGSRFGTGDNVASAIAKLTTSNFNSLKNALGRTPTQGELYLAHQQGAQGAIDLLRNPNASAAEIVGYDAIALNGGHAGMTAGEFASKWTSKFPGIAGDAVSRPGSHPEFDENLVPANQRSDYQAPGFFDMIGDFFVRGAIVILGFIFVAVGLAMFKPGIVVNAIPAARAAKGAASILK